MKQVDVTGLTKGEIMKIAYNGNLSNVDTAIPLELAQEMNYKTFWYVYDYNGNNSLFGRLTNLVDKAKENNIQLIHSEL